MTPVNAVLPPHILLDPLLQDWLREDIGRGDRTTQSLLSIHQTDGQAEWIVKSPGVIAGLPIAGRVFQLLNSQVSFITFAGEGEFCQKGQVIARMHGSLDTLLMGERVALNIAMRLSGIATLTRQYVEKITDLPTKFVDTRKTTPGLRILEKYATQLGGAINHRMGLDDAVMIKDNHIAAVGGIGEAITRVRSRIPYTMTIEVETENLDQVQQAIQYNADIIMLDNMSTETMRKAVQMIRASQKNIKIEASGNINLETIRTVAETGVDYISSSAPITQSKWLDLSMNIIQ
ncbi:carboxylating nicotinate-nucleotide diphosphorylase [Calothrix sp. NIES-3974]|uniref:carboxylating nicotinate-nucleotide diphosphorylase n=1 Tax=Calothrix sp. NIES-3974 TaxID=2005462 RepID=UPI000B60DDE1|nr:carboxylating nicotinate-nucleotide diphosphorylase [Calothrix sp. NIES-3974]BAZ05179.1 nicotinate-nucleotide pyrophosphorylase [Calothrix sp. NIES-3974]